VRAHDAPGDAVDPAAGVLGFLQVSVAALNDEENVLDDVIYLV